MSITTYRIIGGTMAIPGVPGLFHAGQEVDVNTDTNEVVATRLLPFTYTPTPPQQTTTVHMSLDNTPIGTWTGSPVDKLSAVAKEATDNIDERSVE